MKNLFISISLSIVAVIGFSSCEKELGALPGNAKVDGNSVFDQATAQIALNGVYYNFANASTIKNDWMNHQVVPGSLSGHIQYGIGATPLETNENTQLLNAGYYWLESYKILNAANGLLKNVMALPDNKFTGNRKNEILAEARFLRAYAHLKLLTYYAEWYKMDSQYGVLLRDQVVTLTTTEKARSSVKESYDFITSDLDFAITNAPAANPNYYVTKWAAMALKIKMLMLRNTSADYAEVISLANTITSGSPFVLEARAEDIFHTKGLASTEVILGLKPQANQISDPYSKSRNYFPAASALWVASAGLKNLYANDPRGAWMIGTATPYTALYAPGTSYFMKYILQGGVPTTVSETDYPLRLTEVYLLKAEAIVRSGGSLSDAKALVHTIQQKAGITATANNTNYLAVESATNAADLLVEIYKETVRSLVAEDGSEWTSLLRLPMSTITQFKPSLTKQTQFIFPVPATEFLTNSLFGDQNPGYPKN
ncbi:RagB/SusD family nutrient uptake outer membrane protein [Pedobacter sp. MC2016-14]|uniref:RagB/SusD family nutrient uptake outer membrane protein n=1 Tax=Pedobacter sp. MC2016-14 TaxID=2897327 RepID=UPI001E28F96B|nr:RagB/SusD family nutrient uptake outer membrane protein [Pedobacter sp. MC2016-14]MCD0488104.1 RagB/SusD family nutrient uptake outer membrane protein [Pedobacter sp. MC2016-14]